ncbi:MAG TPA: bis-aminopropyl spermidine synthase family protein [Rhizomicrobium sp.]|nr:bis-aminopropyl spermidine synthase family protein [Rhizomicrobium sp.]
MSLTTGLLVEVAEATKLREGPEGVAAFLRTVHRIQPAALADVARAVHLPLPVASAVRRELEKRDLLTRNQGIALSPEGLRYAESVLDLRAAPELELDCSACDGTGLTSDPRLEGMLKTLERHFAGAPAADVTLDQAYCTPETALRRALLLLRDHGLNGRRLLCVGDDDMIALAVGVVARDLGVGDTIAGLTAVDIDPRQLDRISAAAKAEGVALNCIQHDLREPLPEALSGRFDVVQTDPPYTLEGARLFLSRGIEALKPGSGHRVLFSFAEWPPDDSLVLQGMLSELGLVATAVHSGFNHYQGATVLGSIGRCYELVTTSRTHNPFGDARYDDKLYTAEVTPRSAIYRCTQCSTRVSVGPAEVVKLIADLKRQGCPKCGAQDFQRVATVAR